MFTLHGPLRLGAGAPSTRPAAVRSAERSVHRRGAAVLRGAADVGHRRTGGAPARLSEHLFGSGWPTSPVTAPPARPGRDHRGQTHPSGEDQPAVDDRGTCRGDAAQSPTRRSTWRTRWRCYRSESAPQLGPRCGASAASYDPTPGSRRSLSSHHLRALRQAHRIQNGAHGRQVLGRIRLAERTAQGAWLRTGVGVITRSAGRSGHAASASSPESLDGGSSHPVEPGWDC